jgi:hypothetical protein
MRSGIKPLEARTFSATLSTSTSGNTTAGSLPPLVGNISFLTLGMSLEWNVQFEGHSLQRFAGALQHRLARVRGASEANLVDSWMARNPRAEIIVAAEGLHNAWREEFLRQLHQLKPTIGSEGPG